MSLSLAERQDIIFTYGECHRNFVDTLNVLQERYPHVGYTRYKVQRVLDLFLDTGSIREISRSCKRPVIENENNVLTIANTVNEDPTTSVRIISRETGIKATSVFRILKKRKLHPFKISLNQELSDEDRRRRYEFCNNMLQILQNNGEFYSQILFSDESTFKSNSVVNRHNMHYWAVENPHWARNVDRQRVWSVNVWGGILGQNVIGPHFFEGNLNAEMYLNFLQNDLNVLLENVPLNIRQHMVFMQDGAPAHSAAIVREYLDQHYGPMWIGRGGPIAWPPRSPDLTPCDFYLWGTVKEKVYKTAPHTIHELKQRIQTAFEEITLETLRNLEAEFIRRLRMCCQENGGSFEHI